MHAISSPQTKDKIHTLKHAWLEEFKLKKKNKAQLFIKYLEKQSFTFLTSGAYKEVYAHKDYPFVVKVSRKGLGNAYPRKEELIPYFLHPIWMDKHIFFQEKANSSKKSSKKAYSLLKDKLFPIGLEDFLKSRDFSPSNCALLNSKPYIIDLSYFPGYYCK